MTNDNINGSTVSGGNGHIGSSKPPEHHHFGFISRFLESEKKDSAILFWSFIVGSLAGLAGAVFQIVVSIIFRWRVHLGLSMGEHSLGSLVIQTTISAVMVFVAFILVRKIATEASGSGVQEIEGALDGVRPARWKRVLPVKFFSGILALGGGMVLGREGPTIQMGGNIGKMIGDLFKISKNGTNTLIAAGAGAGLSAAFNSPLAGILFVIEEMRPQFKYNFLSVQSVLIASAMADIVLRALTSQSPVISMPILEAPPLSSLWLFLVFGAIFGVLGVVFNYLLVKTLDFFSNLKGWSYRLTGLYVGALIGIAAWIYPYVVGGGYRVIPDAIHGNFGLIALVVLFVARFGTTMISYGSGSPGGIFAPMLALGTLFGMFFGTITHGLLPDLISRPEIFAVAGMAALFCATVRAPLTGITLAIEMTGNYWLILPLLLTCMTATLVAQGLGGKPIYTVLLKRTLNIQKAFTKQTQQQN